MLAGLAHDYSRIMSRNVTGSPMLGGACRRVDGQHGPYFQPSALARVKLQRAAVQLRDPLDDRKPETGPAAVRTRITSALKRRLQRLEFLHRQAFAAIAHRDISRPRIEPSPH